MPLPVLISIPHGGTDTPRELGSMVSLSARALFEDGDAFTREIYDVDDAVAHVESASVARAFVDLNRASNDLPPDNPDGVVKETTCYGAPIYRSPGLPDDLIHTLLDRYYHPYHQRLAEVASSGAIRLGLDCHSMAAVAPPISPDPGKERPLFCLSNNDGRTAPQPLLQRLASALAEAFECDPSAIGLNQPFKGGFITRSHATDEVPWIQIEMNRSLYLAEPWFDEPTMKVDSGRITALRDRFLRAISRLDLG